MDPLFHCWNSWPLTFDSPCCRLDEALSMFWKQIEDIQKKKSVLESLWLALQKEPMNSHAQILGRRILAQEIGTKEERDALNWERKETSSNYLEVDIETYASSLPPLDTWTWYNLNQLVRYPNIPHAYILEKKKKDEEREKSFFILEKAGNKTFVYS